MKNEILKWAEEESSNATLASNTHNNQFYVGQAFAFRQLIDKINSIPVPSVEGYLEGKAQEAWEISDDTADVVYKSDALAALQSLASDKDEEIAVLNANGKDSYKKMLELQAEVERLKGVLGDLVELKRWKDKHGSDEAYLKNRDAVWVRAFELIPEPPKQ